mmetsp:Transcript_82746/g.233874  ORF Transcript_82746/g.233874 Transcript_82746/m.233874 type:complete len:99 (-) Transcript_82746:1739-2035(-)
MDRPGAHSWEHVAEAIQNALDEREILSLLEAVLKAPPIAQQAHQQQQGPTGLGNATISCGVVDLFGCADTSTSNQLVGGAGAARRRLERTAGPPTTPQ